ncbi:MAG: hypothetical protein KY475_13170 [Planctomycetes bacterium]|nr:hypothetical protein [Planctomycetota bacterium]
MVVAHHLIWTAYGWWLPNDPRGAMSDKIRCAKLLPLGDLHQGRKKIQPAGREIREFYDAARGILKHPLLTFTNAEISAIAAAFEDVMRRRTYTCYGCAILPDHVHLLIRKHRDQAETMIEHLQDASLTEVPAKPQARRGADHPVWGGPGWKVFLNTRDDIKRTIRYIEQNPVKIHRPPQDWSFVKPYDGWLPGQIRRPPRKPSPARSRRSP